MKLVICFQFQFSYYHCISTRPFLCPIYPFRGLILIYATRIPHTSVTPRPRSTHVPCPSNFLIHTPGVSWVTDSLKLKDQPPVNDNSQPVTFSVLYIQYLHCTIGFCCVGRHAYLPESRNPFLKLYQVREALNGSILRYKAPQVQRVTIESHNVEPTAKY